ncbi:MAG: hypothetical protein K5Q00_01985, partial [Gammaproteobacteria bacterium]|nr:hypothetical protein [Gammaproteobacteria bacterium]
RITLGKLAKGVSSFEIEVDKQHRIILTPMAEIPARERWLFENPEALAKVKEGLRQSAAGKVHKLDPKYYTDVDEKDDKDI